MNEPKCTGCPFRRDCPDYPGPGGISAGQTASTDRIGPATTNGPGLAPETVLATPIRTTEQEDYPEW